MDYLRLGSTGLMVSRIGLGMMSYGAPGRQSWALTEDQAEPVVRHAAESGIIFFDTADSYSGGASDAARARADAGRSDRPADFDVADAVRAVAGERGLPPAQIALAWLHSKDAVTAPIIGATRSQHIDQAVEALALRLSLDEIARLEAPYLPRLLSDYS